MIYVRDLRVETVSSNSTVISSESILIFAALNIKSDIAYRCEHMRKRQANSVFQLEPLAANGLYTTAKSIG